MEWWGESRGRLLTSLTLVTPLTSASCAGLSLPRLSFSGQPLRERETGEGGGGGDESIRAGPLGRRAGASYVGNRRRAGAAGAAGAGNRVKA